MDDNVSWANAKLAEAQYRALGLRHALSEQRLDSPQSAARTSFVEQCLAELHAVEIDVLHIREAVGESPDITTALHAISDDRARLEQFSGAVDPPWVNPSMTWAEAFRQSEVMGYAQSLIDEITAQVRPEAADPLGTLFRSDGPYKGAQNFARSELAAQIEHVMVTARRDAAREGDELMADRFPGFDYKTGDPPLSFQVTIRGQIQELVPVLFSMDAAYVTGDLFNMLVSVNAHAKETLGAELGAAAIRVTLLDLLFLRGQLHALASYAASLPRGTVACESLTRTVAILMTAAHGSGPGKIPAGYHPELEAVHFYVDAFMRAMIRRLDKPSATAAPTPGAPTSR